MKTNIDFFISDSVSVCVSTPEYEKGVILSTPEYEYEKGVILFTPEYEKGVYFVYARVRVVC